jgi:GDSL-like Lipase/Acylhydrolase family
MRGAIAACALSALICGFASAALPPAASASEPSYVAMGDSYTSGPGLTPYAPESPPECGRSSINYAHLTAHALGLSLQDVSCSGASRYDFTAAQYSDQPPQFDALSESTEVVSVGMGGNDNDIFGRIASGCAETDSSDTHDRGAPCKRKYGKEETEAIKKDAAPYTAAIAEIHTLAPHAKVFIMGAPDIASSSGRGCFETVPWTTADFHWINTIEHKFIEMLQKAAKADGYTYVELSSASVGHDVCEPLGTRWVEPLIDPADGAALHPNALGQEHDALALESAMREAGIA